jgi:hypothetical protein
MTFSNGHGKKKIDFIHLEAIKVRLYGVRSTSKCTDLLRRKVNCTQGDFEFEVIFVNPKISDLSPAMAGDDNDITIFVKGCHFATLIEEALSHNVHYWSAFH